MPTITVDIDHLTTAGAANLPDAGTPLIQFYPPRMVVGSAVVVSDPVDVYLSAGSASVVLPANPAGTAYRAVERFPGGVTRYFRVTADAAYKDLVDIDPATFLPVDPSAGAALAAQIAATLAASPTSLTRAQMAKTPDLLITGTITRDANGVIASASVVWGDGTAGTFTTDSIDASGAINGYHITYGSSPVVNTYTQPTITRDATGAATNVPAIVVT
jgi:hypothetical protein